MANPTQNGVLKRDDNDSPVMGGTSNVDNKTIVNSSFDPVTRRLLTDTGGTGGSITVTDGTTTVTGTTIIDFTSGATVSNAGGGQANVAITGGGTGTPGGLNTQIQYNNAGSFGGITGAVTDGTAVSLTAPHLLNPTINGAGAGLATLVYPNTASNATITVPATTGTLALTSDLTGFVTAVTGTSNRITSSGGTTPAIDIAATYVGQTSITTLGTITTGTWGGSVVTPLFGGTGVANNAAMTVTGSGNFAYTRTLTAATNVTFPTTGTLATLAGSESLTNKSVNGVTLTTGGGTTTFLNANGAYSTPAGAGTVTSVTSATGDATVATTTTTPVITIVSAPKWTTARNLAGNSVDGSANVAFANKFIVQGTTDAGLSGAQFLGGLGTGIVKNTTTTGVLSIAIAADFPTLNQNTTGSAATLTTARTIGTVTGDATSAGSTFDGSANNTNALTLATVNSNVGSFTSANITVNAKGLITAASNGSSTPGITWTEVTGTSQSAAINSGYITNNAGLVTVTLPSTAAVGSIVEVAGKGAGGWKIAQNASGQIHFGNQNTTSGTGGSLASTLTYDSIRLVCSTANNEWVVLSVQGNITVI